MKFKLRQHQTEAVNKCSAEKKGHVTLPTGTGKTTIEIEIIRQSIVQRQDNGEGPGVYVIVSPRILLSFQHLQNVIKQISPKKIQCLYMNVNSGEFPESECDKIIYESGLKSYDIKSTTNKDDIVEWYGFAQHKNIPLIISSTFDSCKRVFEAQIPIVMYLFDEAHYMVDFSGKINEATQYPCDSMFFFTATPKITDSKSGRGMNNEDLFGQCLYKKTPREMIEAGEIVKPALHLVSSETNYDFTVLEEEKLEEEKEETADEAAVNYDYKSTWLLIEDAFKYHKQVVTKESQEASGGRIGAKLLVVCEGQKELMGIYNTQEFKDFRNRGETKVLMLSSNFGILLDNDIKKIEPPITNIGKRKFFNRLHGFSDLDDVIILHVDMLAEGIDVPGITGVMPFRNVGRIKFLQNIGRATRLHSDDRDRLYSGELTACDFDNYIKPYAWIILPFCTQHGIDYGERYKRIIQIMRSDYEFQSSELVILGNGNVETDIEEIEPCNEVDKRIKSVASGIRSFLHEIEDTETLKKTYFVFDKINVFSDVEKAEIFKKVFEKSNFLGEAFDPGHKNTVEETEKGRGENVPA